MTLGPTLTYELAASRQAEREAASTGAAAMRPANREIGWLRRVAGHRLISLGERLAGSDAVAPVAGTL